MRKIFICVLLACTSCTFKSNDKIINDSFNNSLSSSSLHSSLERRTRIDNQWDEYLNEEFGFKMKIPTNIKVTNSSGHILIDYGMWDIEKANVPQEQLPTFIKTRFGSDCIIKKFADWIPSNSKQLVVTVPEEIDFFGKTKCLPRYSAWPIFYNTKKELLIYWDAGQEDRFSGSGGIMASSFRFLEN